MLMPRRFWWRKRPERIDELIAWGTQFDREGTKLTFGREGAHSRNRILHAHGDSTGREILRALYAKAKTMPEISVRSLSFQPIFTLMTGVSARVHLIDDHGQNETVPRSAVLLATGGMGQLYLNTTNPPSLREMASPWPIVPAPRSLIWSSFSFIPRRFI